MKKGAPPTLRPTTLPKFYSSTAAEACWYHALAIAASGTASNVEIVGGHWDF